MLVFHRKLKIIGFKLHLSLDELLLKTCRNKLIEKINITQGNIVVIQDNLLNFFEEFNLVISSFF